MFPCLRLQETFVAETKFASREAKMFLNLFRNIFLPQHMFPRLRTEEIFQETIFPQQWSLVCGRLKKRRLLRQRQRQKLSSNVIG